VSTVGGTVLLCYAVLVLALNCVLAFEVQLINFCDYLICFS
jgi:hypothetical protein